MRSFLKVRFIVCAVFLVNLTTSGQSSAQSQAWNLPVLLNDNNTSITFEVDATQNSIQGESSGVTGRIWLSNPHDLSSISSEIQIPFPKFSSSSNLQESKLLDIIAASSFNTATLKTSSSKPHCYPKEVDRGQVCRGQLHGTASLHGVTRDIHLPFKLERIGARYIVSGQIIFRLDQFKLEELSTLIAKMAKSVKIEYKLRL